MEGKEREEGMTPKRAKERNNRKMGKTFVRTFRLFGQSFRKARVGDRAVYSACGPIYIYIYIYMFREGFEGRL
jgi:hypothetical protein